MAGYPSVIGTFWQISDKHSANIELAVRTMAKGVDTLDVGCAAEGLHHAVRTLKEETRVVQGFSRKGQDDPLIWASYIHVGGE